MAKRARGSPQSGLSWDELEEALATGSARGRTRASTATELDALFDESELRALRRLAAHARLVRSRSPALGNVVFLHGITGSNLATVDASGDRDHVWVNVPRLIAGRIARLKLRPDGKQEADARHRVELAGLNKTYYARGVLALRARWNVEPFAYDWRKDIDFASDELARFIREKFPGKPVHLVAHSMGGLVARNLIRRQPQLWDAMKDPDLAGGGRLVMLGTPNYGSYAIPQVLTGSDQMMELLELLDISHNMPELLEITNSFPGSYMLLPAPQKLPTALRALYQRDTWGDVPGVSQQHLDRTFQFYHDLEQTATIDPARMIYVAGARRATITGMAIVARGEFEYQLSFAGDGRVPHALGLLKDVATYYVDEIHGDLARNETVLAAVDELLEQGTTSVLGTTVLRRVDRAVPTMRDYRTAADKRLMEELERIAREAKARGGPDAVSADDAKLGADALVKAALGSGPRSLPKAALARRPEPTDARPADRIALRVAVRFGDVARIKAPIVVVGHYRGVQPVNAIGAIDQALGGWITLAVKQGMIGGSLGETFFIPATGKLGADAVVVAGMGDFGRFTPADLRLLASNVAIGASALGLSSITSVNIGAGEGNLDPAVALAELLEGVGAGLVQLRDVAPNSRPSLTELVLVEKSPRRYRDLVNQMRELAAKDALSTIRLKLTTARADDARKARSAEAQSRRRTAASARDAGSPPTFQETRLTVERVGDDMFRFSALSRTAVVPVREVRIRGVYAQAAADALRDSSTRDEQQKYGRLLYTYLVPEDFHELIDGPFPVRLVVDRATAAFPWEMACFPARAGQGRLRWLGIEHGLSRQFRTLLSRAPGISPPLNDRLRVLVIADPAPERELQLPGARAEGRKVVEILKKANGTIVKGAKIEIEVVHRIGSAECEPVEILALLLSGDFDVVHFAGHGDYDPKNPASAGWVFGRDRFITANEIFRARKVPRLVFANACFSGVLHEGAAFAPDELSRGLATIAQAFFERGVTNYIGSGWPVNDEQALSMAEVFYRVLLGRETIGKAMHDARRAIFDLQMESTWGAYQHYGDPNDTVLRVVA